MRDPLALAAERGRLVEILLIEDEDPSIEQSLAMLQRAAPGAAVQVVRNKEAAIAALSGGRLDLILCDLRIPPTHGSLGAAEEHGLAVHRAARDMCPGTPLIFLTAFATKRNTRTQLSAGGVAEMFGELELPVVQLAEKDPPNEAEELVGRIFAGLQHLSTRSVSVQGAGDVDDMLLRAVRMYVHRIGALSAEVVPLSGLSGAAVATVTVATRQGGSASLLVKVLERAKALDELRRYERYVANRLAPGSFAPAMSPMSYGLRDKAALLFTLADRRSQTLFEVLEAEPQAVAVVVNSLKNQLTPLVAAPVAETVAVSELRKARVPDARLDGDHRLSAFKQEIDALRSLEEVYVTVPTALCHGDLHGENILIDSSGRAVLIDFGDAGPGATMLDPVTLELSLLFHAASPFRDGGWLTPEVAGTWSELDIFADAFPRPDLIRACRTWSAAAGPAEALWAVSYAHAMRQLKYRDVSPPIALAVARSAITQLRQGE